MSGQRNDAALSAELCTGQSDRMIPTGSFFVTGVSGMSFGMFHGNPFRTVP